MFDFIGIDWGSKRFGLSFGDSTTGLIIPYRSTLFSNDIWHVLQKEIQFRNITHIVIGIPTNFFLQDTQVTAQIRDFIDQLVSTFPTIKIETINERGTSQDARITTQNKDDINHIAAVHILTRYFENI